MSHKEISLKWNGYQINMLENLRALFHDGGYADVTIVVEGISLKAHKVILSACSTLFRNIFMQNVFEHPIIVFNDISVLCMRSLLIFMYNGEVNVTEDYLPTLLKAAESLKIKGLSVAPENGLEDVVNNLSPTKKPKLNYEELNEVPDVTQCLKEEKNSDEGDFYIGEKIIPKIEPPDVIGVEAILNDLSDESNTQNIIDNKSRSVTPDTICNGIAASDLRGSNITMKKSTNAAMKHKKMSKAKQWRDKPQKILPKECHKRTICSKLIQECKKSCLEIVSGTEEESLDSLDKDVHMENETDLHTATSVQPLTGNVETSANIDCNNAKDDVYYNPTFPCPFCSRVYLSWGYRRRHVKSRHGKNKLTCKWCMILLDSQGAWFEHTVSEHGIARSEARESLVVMVEAHAVLSSSTPSAEALILQLQSNGETLLEQSH